MFKSCLSSAWVICGTCLLHTCRLIMHVIEQMQQRIFEDMKSVWCGWREESSNSVVCTQQQKQLWPVFLVCICDVMTSLWPAQEVVLNHVTIINKPEAQHWRVMWHTWVTTCTFMCAVVESVLLTQTTIEKCFLVNVAVCCTAVHAYR